MKSSKSLTALFGAKKRKLQKIMCVFLLAVMLVPFIPEGALRVDALNSTFGPVSSAVGTNDITYTMITGKPGVYIVGDGYAITWVTSFKGNGWVTYTKNGKTVSLYDERNGIVRINDTIHTVKVPEEDYQYLCNGYTVHSREATALSYGTLTLGNEWQYTTKLKDSKPGGNEEADILVLTDIHGVASRASNSFGQYNAFLGASSDPDIVVFSGDAVSDISNQGDLENLFKIMGNSTWGQYPIVYCRGNHETRGYYATKLLDYFPTKTGEFYYDFTYGNLWGVVVDTGEDKPDNHYEYGFLANYKEYLLKQEAWLLSLRKPTDSSIKYRLGVYHIPSLEYLARRMYFNNTTEKKIESFFAGTNISDAMAHLDIQFAISGHDHKFQISDHSIKVTCEMTGKTEAEVEQYMVGAIYKQETVVNGLPAYEHGYADTFTKNGASLSFVKSSLVHKTFIAGGDGGGTGFVKLSTAGKATVYALDNNGNDAKVDSNGNFKTDGTGTAFSTRSNPRTVNFGAERNLSVSSAKTAERGTFVHFTPLNPVWAVNKNKTSANDWILTSRNYVSAGTAVSGISMTAAPTVFESGGDWYNVVWQTNIASAGYVQLTYNGKTYQFFDEVGGYRRSNDTIHTVKVPKEYLNNNKYFVGSYSIKYVKGYTFDKYCTSAEYLFEDRSGDKTPNVLLYSNVRNQGTLHGYSLSTAVSVAEKLGTDCSFIAVTGDLTEVRDQCSNVVPGEDTYFKRIFEAASAISGGTKLVVYSRGDSECRGYNSTELIKYIPTSTGEFYYTFNYGDYTFINIDTAEDKVQTDSSYNGRILSNNLYAKEDAWLDEILSDNNNGFKDTLAVVSHTPIYKMDDDNGTFKNSNLEWGYKLKKHGAVINFAGSSRYADVNPYGVSERSIFTVSNGGSTFHAHDTSSKTKQVITAASVLLSKEYAYVTFCQYYQNDGKYYYTNSNYSTAHDYDMNLAKGEKSYSLKTGNAVSYSASAPALSGNTYTISTPSHLVWISEQTRGGNNFSGKTFVLANSIDLMLYPFKPIGGYEEVGGDDWCRDDVYVGSDWTPRAFSGTFDGKGYKITNLHILPSKSKYVNTLNNNQTGLFGAIRNGHIKNLTVEGGLVKGGWNTGALAGYIDSTTTSPATMTNCYSNVTVYAPGETNIGASKVGGLLGSATYNVTINQCANFGNVIVTRSNANAGGLIGAQYCYDANSNMGTLTVSNSFVRGNVYARGSASNAGGIVGYFGRTNAKITNCYVAASIWGNTKGAIWSNNHSTSGTLTVSNTYFAEDFFGASAIRGVSQSNVTVSNSGAKSASVMKTQSFVSTLGSSIYQLPEDSFTGIKANGGYPIHKAVLSFEGDVEVLTKLVLKDNSSLVLENGYLEGVVLGASVDSILANLANSSGVSISSVATGGVISLTVGGKVVDSAIIVIKGDVDGDGTIGATDYLRIKSHFIGLYNLENEFFKAADVDENTKIETTDFMRIKSHFVGAFDLYA